MKMTIDLEENGYGMRALSLLRAYIPEASPAEIVAALLDQEGKVLIQDFGTVDIDAVISITTEHVASQREAAVIALKASQSILPGKMRVVSKAA